MAQLGAGAGSGSGAGAGAGSGIGAAAFGGLLFGALFFGALFLGAAFFAVFFAAFFADFFADFLAAFFADFFEAFFADFFFAATTFFFLAFFPLLFFALAIEILLLPPIPIHRAFQVDRAVCARPFDQFGPGRGPPVAQSRSSIVCTTGTDVPPAICIMHPMLPAAIMSGLTLAMLATFRSRNLVAMSGWRRL
jgi:hypothetical protein